MYEELCIISKNYCKKTSDILKTSVICRATCGANWSLSFYSPVGLLCVYQRIMSEF